MDFLKKDQLPGSSSMKSALTSNVWALWTIRIVLVIYASFGAPNLNKAGALFFNNMIVRLVLAILIIYLCYVDPTSAILLAVSFVVSVQTLNKYRIPSGSEDPVDTFADNMGFTEEEEPGKRHHHRGAHSPPKRDPEMERFNMESFQNVASSEESSEMISERNTFTSQEQLQDAQANTVQQDQSSQVQTWKEQMGAQGLNSIKGYNIDSSDSNSNLAQF